MSLDAELPVTILVVEDVAVMRRTIAKIFEHEGWMVMEAANGREAISIVKKSAPDIILLDVMMPVMNGMDCLGELQKELDTAVIPIIMVTSKSEAKDVKEAIKKGARDYIVKPFEKEILVQKVKHLLFPDQEAPDES